MKKTTFAVIVGNRGFFPDALARQGRKDILETLKKNGYNAVALSTQDTKYGVVETFEDAKKCAQLFARNSDSIDGIIVTLPNFGDEKGIAETIKRSGLSVPILIQAEPDAAEKMAITNRRDSFCGKISACNNLRQAGVSYTLTESHTVAVKSGEFKNELENFAAVCSVVKGLRNARLGAIGARTGAFNTVRYSEKLLELAGISIETIDLSEILGKAALLADNDRGVKRKLNAIKKYVSTDSIPAEALLKMAKFGYVVDQWTEQSDVAGTAIQCWTSLRSSCPAPARLTSWVCWRCIFCSWPGGRRARFSTGTTTMATSPTSVCVSIAAICRFPSSRPPGWIIRRLSPAPWARKTHTGPSSAG